MKKKIIISATVALALLIAFAIWHTWLGTTRVAFINYQTMVLGRIAHANDNPLIKVENLNLSDLEDIDDYDMVFVEAMGLRLTAEQRDIMQQASENGTPVVSTMITNPENDFCSIDSIHAERLKRYIGNGGRENYRNMLNYVRKHIDRKIIYAPKPGEVAERIYGMLHHSDPDHPEEEDLQFNSVAEYRRFLETKGLWREGAPAVVITGSMGEPKELIAKLEETGNMVFPVNSIRTFVENGHADSVNVAAVINMAHGRLGDAFTSYLKRKNIPLFAPLNVNRRVEKWEADKMGMSGGFLSQSVSMPEIDGALRSFALFAHYPDGKGLEYVAAVPERLEMFVQTVNNYISLRSKPNREKRVAIYYYKGPGQTSMTAGGMEVAPSLHNLLLRLKREGYDLGGLPATPEGLAAAIQKQGAVFDGEAEGAIGRFMKNGNPILVNQKEYDSWVRQTLRPEKYAETVAANGEFPGRYMNTPDGKLGVARIQFGNVALLPQNAAGVGDNSFKIAHGTDAAPPHPYIASYLWTRYGFKADMLIHFGTHGSLEFTPKKQIALSSLDWPDRLVGALPHFYLYTIGNVGEGLIAKRRSYAGLQSYLTPPFMESGLRGVYGELSSKLKLYNENIGKDKALLHRTSLAIKRLTVRLGFHRDLGLDSILTRPYSEEEILRIDNFAEELSTEKITGQLYTLGVPYEPQRISSSLVEMCADPIAYSLFSLDRLRGRADNMLPRQRSRFNSIYLHPAKRLVQSVINNPSAATDALVCKIGGLSPTELKLARKAYEDLTAPSDMMRMGAMGQGKQGKSKGSAMHGTEHEKKIYDKEEKAFAFAVRELERTIKSIGIYKQYLLESPERELSGMINAMNGGYTAPSPGGDPIVNPNTLPTGRNLYGINAEATPSEAAWEKGRQLAENTLELYKRRHNGELPHKVSYTLWSGEFVETEGATIAQILYMLGVEPLRDSFGRVSDLRLIPSEELGRKRIDVVVQTSGQLRDLAASRLFLINRAVEMAAAAKDDVFENEVSMGMVEAERLLTEKGIPPKEARKIASQRIFGGMNGSYGTGIQGMVMSGDKWEKRSEIANTYLNNMGAFYGSEKDWEQYREHAFEAALTRTDVVVQPRQSNTWGALSLDHVYEFMGGLNLAVRHVTGKDPDAYLSDYRNRHNVRMQEVKEAIGVESRTTILNPVYIKEKMKGGASAAGGFAEVVENTYGWNVMKPQAIDKELWDDIYSVYVKDKFNLGTREFFERKSPAALQQITAVMLESVRKGMWKASPAQVSDIARLHVELVNKHQPSGSKFVGNNAKLCEFIASKVDAVQGKEYRRRINDLRNTVADSDKKGTVMKREEMSEQITKRTRLIDRTPIVIAAAALALAVIVFVVRKRRKGSNR